MSVLPAFASTIDKKGGDTSCFRSGFVRKFNICFGMCAILALVYHPFCLIPSDNRVSSLLDSFDSMYPLTR